MTKFSKQSLERLSTAHPNLQVLFREVVEGFDCSILEGHRDQPTQDKYYNDGKSRLKWPEGKHNKVPSQAVDVAPCPIDWDDTARFYYFAGYVKGVADQLGIKIRFGGDWNLNTQVKDETFLDLVHFELIT